MAQYDNQEPRNVVGAIIFFSYIVAALAITGTIVYDLGLLYKTRYRTPQLPQDGVRKSRLRTSLLMTIISFSTLSYHMLSFLIDSYSAWSLKTGKALPKSVLGDESLLGVSGTRTDLQIWQWATSSTLFQDFAEAIIGDPKSQFWTVKVLLFSYIWDCYMAEKGLLLHVPRLWAYFAINQILPVSFSQNLFLLACQLSPAPRLTSLEVNKPPQTYRLAAVLVTMAYLQCLITAPSTIGSPTFMLVLLTTRLLLLSPLLVASLLQRSRGSNAQKKRYGNVMYRTHITTIVLAGWYIMEQGAWWPTSLDEAFDALNGNHAVSALGYDLVIGVVSLGIYNALGRA